MPTTGISGNREGPWAIYAPDMAIEGAEPYAAAPHSGHATLAWVDIRDIDRGR